ncbi:acyl-CoA dehydrogenase family protein [Streptomyces sp. NPDC057253]|uniref:acyl-CoA dehydrogenase family protein n=1 Tax=Streptomyces sp. NPDC057253 TaxID=3346069 RepID=UPI003628FF02
MPSTPTWWRPVSPPPAGPPRPAEWNWTWPTAARAPKHPCGLSFIVAPTLIIGAGISYLLIPMRSEGITVRPLKDISGGTHFSEVYLDEVRVPVSNLGTGPRHSRRALDAVLEGRDPGPAASVNRLVRAEFDQRLHEVALRVLGSDAVLGQREPTAPEGGRWTYGYLMSRSSTIGAGTGKIQRNTLAEKVLGLPSRRKEAR